MGVELIVPTGRIARTCRSVLHNQLGDVMLDWTSCPAVERHSQKLSGAWIFRGTRVPVSALFSNLEGGATVDEFIEWFPGVSREQVNLVLEHAARSLAVA
jgi:uncharacterized protein (DUF433 family)